MILNRISRLVLSVLMSVITLTSFAQDTALIVENFEFYTAGARLCNQAPAYWYTWNNGPGTAEDPEVTDSLAYEGSNSLVITGANDILLDLKGQTSGRYEVSFFVMIPAGNTGFYGLLQQFSGNESKWGMHCFFNSGSQGTIKAGGSEVTFYFNHNQWVLVRNIIDLDNDHAEIYINDALKVEWQWSLGLSGAPGLVTLDALNFFASNANQQQPLMYVDSIIYKKLPSPGAPLNLIASVAGNNVNLLWDAPLLGSPSGYKIYRNNEVIASGVSILSYNDTGVYPGKYAYTVKAIYGTGLSQPAGPVEVIVAGGTDRNFVLLEIATGTWCTYCPGAALGADDLVEDGKQVAIIEYHNNDDYSNPDADHRNAFYSVTGFPTAYFDGSTSIIGGNMTQSMYPAYMPAFTTRIQKLGLFSQQMEIVRVSARELNVSVTVKKIYPYANNQLRMHLVLTETNIPETWQVIMNEVNYVCRKMYPDFNGSNADFSNDSILNFSYTVLVDSSYNFSNCTLIAFLQDNSTKEILQASKTELFSLGTDDYAPVSLLIYPNPASQLIMIKSEVGLKNILISDMFGHTVIKSRLDSKEAQVDVSSLNQGLYLLNIMTAQGAVVRKCSIIR